MEKPFEFAPPSHLSARAIELWNRLAPSVGITEGRRQLLIQALTCLDRLEQLRLIIAGEGLTVTNAKTGMLHASPLLKAEVELRRQFASLWKQLGLNITPNGYEAFLPGGEEYGSAR